MKPRFPFLRSLLLTTGSSLLAVSSASAQSWSGATDGDWLTTTNWTGGTEAGSTTSTDTDIAVFDVNTNNTIGINMATVAGNYYLGAIDNTNATARIIQNTEGTTGVLTLNGATVNGVANTIFRNSTATLMTIGNSASGTLGLALGNATTNVIQTTGTGGITINSIISGVGGITRQGGGSGVLTLAANNSYIGVTAINTGNVTVSHANALGATGLGNNSTIAVTGTPATGGQLTVNTGITTAENITLTGGGETGGQFNPAITGAGTISGDVTLSSMSTGVRLGGVTFAGKITRTGTARTIVFVAATVNNAIDNLNGGLTLY